jgi:nucleoside-diphosphate-sugar epimerase
MILITGFPGFLGSQLVPRIARRTDDEIACLVQERFAPMAAARVAQIEQLEPALRGRIRLVEGDITLPHLGLRKLEPIREMYHLAAIYDISVDRPRGMAINVEGTRNALDTAADSPTLERFHYVSTCYVSGRHPGTFSENDLDVGQRFNNFYEETKFLAEVEVQKLMKGGFPATVYRPSVVVGDSATGATQKFDGPYYVIRWILRQPKLAVLPVVGHPATTFFNMVPRDFLLDALSHLSGEAGKRGEVYQLADPEPLTVDAILRQVAEASGRIILRIPLPLSVAKGAIDYVPGVYRLMGIPSGAVDYFVHPTRYTTLNATRDLAGSGIAAPPAGSYIPRLVDFVRNNPSISSEAMV